MADMTALPLQQLIASLDNSCLPKILQVCSGVYFQGELSLFYPLENKRGRDRVVSLDKIAGICTCQRFSFGLTQSLRLNCLYFLLILNKK